MSLPADLTFNSQPDPSDKNYTLFTIQPLQVGTPYKFQFQWIFEDPKLNELVGDNWSNTFEYTSRSGAKPLAVSNLTATWLNSIGTKTDTLFVRFNHDTTFNNGTNNNTGVDKYLIRLTFNGDEVITKDLYLTNINRTGTAQVYELTSELNKIYFGGFFRSQFTVTVIAIDSINNLESDPVTILSDIAPNPLDAPVITSIVPGNFEYSVFWQQVDLSLLEGIYIEEVINTSDTPPTSGYQFVKKSFNSNPVVVPANDLKRWVRAYFVSKNGQQTGYSNYVTVTPIDPVKQGADETPPNNVTSVTAVWNGNDIEITPVFPGVDQSIRYIIELTANSQTRTFLRWKNQLVSGKLTITQSELYSNFGAHYTAFTGLFKTTDAADNTNTGTAFTVPQKTNPLTGVVPTFTLTGITNGYTATWTLPAAASFAKVYESGTSWGAGNPLETDLVFSGQSPAIVKKTVYTLRYVKIKYVTVDGFESSWSAEQTVTPIDSIGADINPPAAPSAGLTATAGIDTTGTLGFNGFINLSWTAVSDSTLRGYRIRFRPYKATAPFENYSYVDSPGTGTTYRLGGLAVGTTYELGIASYDEFNNTTASYSSFANTTISGTPSLSNYITAGAAGFQIGSGIKDSTGAQNATAQGIYLSNNNYWYLTAADTARLKIGGSTANYLLWDGTKITIDGDVIAKGGSFSGNIELKTTGASIWNGPLNSGGTLAGDGFVLNNNGLSIRKGSINLRLDTSDGGIYAQFGQIAGWTIDSAKIERLTASQYSGISSSGTYAFYAGASASGNSGGDTAAPFWVKPDGSVRANNISITGGSLTIGTNFSVLSTGALTASNANINGAITATSGKITGNFQIESPGTLYIGGLLADTSVNRILLNTAGIAAYPSGSSTANFALLTDGSATLKKGTIAGWTITDTTINKSGIELNSQSNYIVASTTISSLGYSTGITVPTLSTDIVLWAGQVNPDSRSSATFRVNAAGVLTATGANIFGKITTGAGTMAFGDSVQGSNNGLYIGNTGDYIYSNGDFRLGNGRIVYTNSTTTLNITNTRFFLNITSNEDGTFGDSTVVQDEGTQQLTIGRAFFYGGTTDPSLSGITARSQYNGGSQGNTAFNIGDIWLQRV